VPLSGGRTKVTSLDGSVRRHEDRLGVVIWQGAGEARQLGNVTSTLDERC
jgi:hypothetical protein